MALTVSTFTRISSGPALMHIYKTADAIATVDNADYFFTAGTADADARKIRDGINQWDVIMHIDTGNSLIGFLLVDVADGTTITTVPLDLA